MKCAYCGAEIPNNAAKFCPKCGSVLQNGFPDSQVRDAGALPNQAAAPRKEKAKGRSNSPRKIKKILLIVAAVVPAVAILGTALFFIIGQLNTQSEINEIIRNASGLAQSQNYQEAIEEVQNGLEQYPESEELDELLSAYASSQESYEIDSILSAAEEQAAAGNYEAAIGILEEGLARYPDAQGMEDALEEYTALNAEAIKAQNLADAKELADAGDYKAAMSMLRAAQAAYGADKAYEDAYETYRRAYLLEESAVFAESGDYAGAIKVFANENIAQIEDLTLISTYNSYCDSYIKGVMAEVNAYCEAWKVTEAISVVRAALKVLPDSAELQEELERLDGMKPIPLTSLSVLNAHRWNWGEGDPKDPFGNDYSSGCNYVILRDIDSSEQSVEYRVYGKYSKLTGVIAPHADIGEEIGGTVLVYADDVLVYSSPVVVQKTDAFTFYADISGAEYIKIVVQFAKNYWDERLILSDVQLWPE